MKKRVNAKIILLPILLILIPPAYLLSFETVDKIFIFVTVLLIGLLVLETFRLKNFNLLVIISVLFILWQMFSSYALLDSNLDAVNSIRMIGLIFAINLFILKYPKSLLDSLSILFSLYVILNIITIILFPNGIYINPTDDNLNRLGWFLGIENQFGYYLTPGILLILLNSYVKYGKINLFSYLMFFLTAVTIYISWSATAVISFIIILILFILNKNQNFLNLKLLFGGYTVVWFMLILFNSSNYLQSIIVNIMNKDLTFSGRTYIWQAVLSKIPESIWIGHGNNTFVIPQTYREFRAHNIILQIILDNGLLGLLVLLFMIYIAIRAFKYFKNQLSMRLLIIALFAILIGGLTEAYKLNHFYIILILLYNYQKIDLLKKDKFLNDRGNISAKKS